MKFEEYKLTRDRLRRKTKLLIKYAQVDLIVHAFNTAFIINYDEPKPYKETMESENSQKWHKAIKDKISSLLKNKT